MVEAKPKGQQLAADPEVTAAPKNGEIGRGRNSREAITPNSERGTSASYLVRRLKRDRPDLAEALAKGECPSAGAAPILLSPQATLRLG